MYCNYYSTPADYIVTDNVDIPHALINAMEYFIAHKAFDMYKGQEHIVMSTEYFNKYRGVISMFLMQTDNNNSDTLQSTDMICNKGLV